MPLNARRTDARMFTIRARLFVIALCGLLSAILWPAPAAANRIYWANFDGPSIAWANLNGKRAGILPTAGAPLDGPMGLAIDSAAGRIYWANYGESPHGGGNGSGRTISWANLDGSGAGQFVTTATIAGPHGLAIDPATRTIYWPNNATSPNTIAFSKLNGSGAGILNTGTATVNIPRGLAIDPTSRRIYWANHDGNRISYANLNGSGGADVATGSATVDRPEGVAIDPAARRIYWGNFTAGANVISWANLNGSGSGNLSTVGTSVNSPHGVALDPRAGRIYWPNYNGSSLSYARLDSSGGADLLTPGVVPVGPALPVLLEKPQPRKAPRVRGRARPGSTLRCRPGTFAHDQISALLYRAPQRVSYAWRRNGRLIARHSRRIRARSSGEYRCYEIGHNAAGSTAEASHRRAVFRIGSGSRRLARRR
jgi:DNA-binding beta-propeller fold protein YncE